MSDLLIPELRVEVEEEDYAKVIAEPLESGFGTTLGNGLRRVLLSSLEGAAITSVRIEGVEHEFSTLPHMQEDVTELLLNLKEVRLRAYSDRPARLYLEASGQTDVLASAIQGTADYEVANPDFHLATLDHRDASLVMDINVESGRGYLPATVSEGLPIGVIPVDALFTPVRRVNFHVSNTRVGQDTDYDRLEIEIWTDGTMSPKVAIASAAEILREQYLPFQRLARPDMPADVGAAEAIRPFEGYDSPIETLSLSVRAYNCLKRSGLTTIGAVLEKSEEELLALRNFGEKSYEELRDKLAAHGYPTPRVDTRRLSANGESAPQAAAPAAVGAQGRTLPELDEEGVGALGAALMEALRESGRSGVNE